MTATARQAIARARDVLASAGIGEAPLEADLLAAEALGMDRARLYASLDATVSPPHQRKLERLLLRRAARKPLAYVLGHKEFYGLTFKVGAGVLVPRPETETLVEEAIGIAGTSPPSPLSAAERGGEEERSNPLLIADVGTGCGAIAVSLALHLPNASVYATDMSRRALAFAQANAETHGVRERIAFFYGNLLSPLLGPVDIIAANLPYLPTARIPTLEPEVSRWEPRRALDGGPDGLRLVRGLLRQSPAYLKPGGAIVLELDPEQMAAASAFALRVFPQARVRCVRDLAGRERVLVVECGAL